MHITSEARFTKIQENNVQIYVLVSISFFFSPAHFIPLSKSREIFQRRLFCKNKTPKVFTKIGPV